MTQLGDKLAVAKAAPSAPGAKALPERVRESLASFTAATHGTPISGERFVRLALTELRRNPKLLACSAESVLGGLMQSAQLGLEIGQPLGQSWLIPRKVSGREQAQWQLGYTGLVALAGRSGVHIMGRAVYENDEFSYEIVDGRDVIQHKRELRGGRGAAWLWYATARWDTGYTAVVMNRSEIDLYRDRSSNPNGPWKTDYDAMAIKTCVLRLRPWIPISAQLSQGLAGDSRVITKGGQDELDISDLASAIDHSYDDAIDAEVVDPLTGEITSGDPR